ncbi:c-type cytochrome [Devosia soli]|uniref:c-type cytochrome n=1 Tax=Devosia soli TaxID=361041 RepID=UPI000699C718|nr:c-type cytochrome [Devosia soli]
MTEPSGKEQEIKRNWRPLLGGFLTATMLFLALPLTGLLEINARPGSNAVVDWYKQTAARQSIALRSAFTEVPPLDDQGMVIRGAGHYELVCADCHGSPAGPPEQIARDLSPPPPPLNRWRPEARLFETVKYGMRHTAMPAWPTHLRDDEIWDMVAFLRQLPSMDSATYADFAYGGAAPGSCMACHGENGEGRGNAMPRLDIQTPAYLAHALAAFRDGSRHSGTMMAAARQLTDDQIAGLSEHFGRSVAAAPDDGPQLGEEIATRGVLERDIPACDSCHGASARADFPRLAGQSKAYLVTQLELFQHLGAERGGRFAHIMAEAVEDYLEEGPHRLRTEELEAVADYYGN